jgi:hypothetical protein
MTKVTLCYTAENAYSDWLEDTYTMDESNYTDTIDRYVKENKDKANALSYKWEDDKPYLNFKMDRGNLTLFRLIDEYMDKL